MPRGGGLRTAVIFARPRRRGAPEHRLDDAVKSGAPAVPRPGERPLATAIARRYLGVLARRKKCFASEFRTLTCELGAISRRNGVPAKAQGRRFSKRCVDLGRRAAPRARSAPRRGRAPQAARLRRSPQASARPTPAHALAPQASPQVHALDGKLSIRACASKRGEPTEPASEAS